MQLRAPTGDCAANLSLVLKYFGQFMTNGRILRFLILQSAEIVHLSSLFFYFDL